MGADGGCFVVLVRLNDYPELNMIVVKNIARMSVFLTSIDKWP